VGWCQTSGVEEGTRCGSRLARGSRPAGAAAVAPAHCSDRVERGLMGGPPLQSRAAWVTAMRAPVSYPVPR
jgi:hypothetical protein